MKIFKNNNAITLMSLVITIIILIILAAVGTYSGIQIVNSSKLHAFTAELKIMQTQVNELYDKDSRNEINANTIGKDISTVQTQADKVFTASESGITTDITRYRYYDRETIEDLGIEGVEGEFFVNISKRSVVSYDGLKYDGETYYTLEQLPDSLYNVKYDETRSESNKPTFNVKVEWLKEGEYRISVNNIDYNENINNWNLEYKLENEDTFKESKDLKVNVYEEGTYKIKIANGIFKSDEVTAIIEEPKVGDIVKYEDILALSGNSVNNTRKEQLLSDLQTYSGASSEYNTTIDRDDLDWRLLDIKDGKIRLISATPTTAQIRLEGYNGYNNAVYLLDEACNILYSSNKGKSQNLKIEDIEENLSNEGKSTRNNYANSYVDTGKYGGIMESTTNLYYPNIYPSEMGCKAISSIDNTNNTLGLSEQKSLISGNNIATSRLKTVLTYWHKNTAMETTDFINSKYYNLFVENEENNYQSYLLSSRCVDCGSNIVSYNISFCSKNNNGVDGYAMFYSDGRNNSGSLSYRPVVTLNSNIILSGNSTNGWALE